MRMIQVQCHHKMIKQEIKERMIVCVQIKIETIIIFTLRYSALYMYECTSIFYCIDCFTFYCFDCFTFYEINNHTLIFVSTIISLMMLLHFFPWQLNTSGRSSSGRTMLWWCTLFFTLPSISTKSISINYMCHSF